MAPRPRTPALRTASGFAEVVLDAFPDPIVSTTAAGVVVRWNSAAAEMFGVPASAALGWALDALVQLSSRDPSGELPERQWATAGETVRAVEVVSWQSAGTDGEQHHLCLRDATRRVADEADVARAEALLRRQARFDALTGLANRYEFEERLEAALADRTDAQVALVVIDLDGFKPINDAFGHPVGDEVLAAIARRLRAAVREQDTVARLGGDEFVILTDADPSGPAAVVRRVRAALNGPVTTTEGPLDIQASVGIAISAPDSDAADLLRRADKAMYRTKLTRAADPQSS